MVDGHDPRALDAAAAAAGRPVVVLCRTDPCRGISLLEARRPKLHYVRFTSKKERELYRESLSGQGAMRRRAGGVTMEIVTKVHARNLVAFAKERPQMVVLSADLTGSCEIAEFQQAYPDRFLSMGIAEQNMVSFAAGLAREGYRPYIHTFAVFIYRQALNQIVSSVAYSNLPVRFFGFLPGITTPGGATHQAIDDVSVLRSVPNMTILEPGDATEIENVLAIVEAQQGPVYVRMLRGEVPRLFPTERAHALWPGAAAPGRDRPHPTHLRHLHRGGPAGQRRSSPCGGSPSSTCTSRPTSPSTTRACRTRFRGRATGSSPWRTTPWWAAWAARWRR